MVFRFLATLWLVLATGCFEAHGDAADAGPRPSPSSETDAGATDAGRTDPAPEPGPVCSGGPCSVAHISAGSSHTCVVLSTGRVGCWGANATGQLGDGTTVDRPRPIAVPAVTDAVDVAAGRSHTCILHEGGRVSCTDRSGHWADAPVGTATGIAAGTGYSAAITSGGVFAWGELVDGWAWSSPVPETIEGGELHLCGLSAGEVWCVGKDTFGSLGDGLEMDSREPVHARVTGAVAQVSAARGHTCAVLDDGEVLCWGAGWDGELGNGSTDNSPTPVVVRGLPPAVHVAGNGHHTCAATGPEGVYCWGDNSHGQVGTTPGPPELTPLHVPRVSSAFRVAVGVAHSCAVDGEGQVWCWGENRRGELGRGTAGGGPEPGPVDLGGG